jgi:hypothetical protein
MYHAMDENDLEIQQWGESVKSFITSPVPMPIVFSQKNHHKVGGIPLAVEVEDLLLDQVGTIHLGDVGAGVVAEVCLRNFHLLRRCRVFGTKNGRF